MGRLDPAKLGEPIRPRCTPSLTVMLGYSNPQAEAAGLELGGAGTELHRSSGGKGRSSTRARRGGRGGARVGALGAELHRGFRGKGGRAGAKLDQNSKGGGAERRRGAPPNLGAEVVRAVMYVGAGAPPR